MAGTLQFDLVSPERRLASLVATEVQIPGADGDLTAMEGHAPTITTLRPGILRALGVDGMRSYIVTGGFAEISASAQTWPGPVTITRSPARTPARFCRRFWVAAELEKDLDTTKRSLEPHRLTRVSGKPPLP